MPAPSPTPCQRLEIKKYPNRRYYDTTHSRHLTLDEIRSLIQAGHDLKATDAKTGDDITAQLLTQIILELETAKLDSFPVPLLLRLIRMNDQLVKDFIEKYFNQALQSFFDYQRQIEENVRQAQGIPAAFPSVSAWTEAMWKPLASAFVHPATAPFPTARETAPDGSNSHDLRELVRDLQQQVAELKQRQPQPKSRRKPNRKPA
ncbi:MAG TPA: polyhydroxyalkanoate synthesis regulator DNA-binding domain-containing protein [Verrucomicrobiae bacterium]